MDCAVCSAVPINLRPPRNTICTTCADSARAILSLINTIDPENAHQKKLDTDKKAATSSFSPQNPSKQGLVVALKWANEMKNAEKETNEKIEFLGAMAASYRERIHTDIFVNSGENSVPIPAHKALLATKSQIFKHMLESDGCKAAPNDSITLYEFNQDELETLLNFLYTGTVPKEKLTTHIYALSIAADKYAIAYLQKVCERHMLANLSSSNALEFLEISDACSGFTALKDAAMRYIVKNMEEIVFSAAFENFAMKNPYLSLQITRASYIDRISSV